jgi:hypothetical protein
MFEVRDIYDPDSNGGDGNGGGSDGNGNGNGGGGTDDTEDGSGVAEGWLDNPEVVVGLVGLIAIGAGSAFGVYRRKKKQGRFSQLLTKLDDVHTSFKMNPQRCETELKKMKVTINEDLKKGVIDENNYSILKGRIDEIKDEIQKE